MKAPLHTDDFITAIQDHEKILFKICNSYCVQVEDRKDLMQEMLIQLWTSFPRYDKQYKFSTWMYRVALNVAISFYRKHRKHVENRVDPIAGILEIAADPLETEPDERLAQLHHFVQQLDSLNKALMVLYLEGHSYKEMAEILGISETNVATKISRIKQQLKQKLTPSQTI